MSWSISIPETEQEDFAHNAKAALDAAPNHISAQQPSAPEEALAQFEAGIEAAVAILAAGVLGDGTVAGSISGHANPGHDISLSSGDSISVSLYRPRH